MEKNMSVYEAYEWLGVEYGVSKREIRAAYAKLCKKYHPEDTPDEFVKLNQAYKIALAEAGEKSTTEAEFNEGNAGEMTIANEADRNIGSLKDNNNDDYDIKGQSNENVYTESKANEISNNQVLANQTSNNGNSVSQILANEISDNQISANKISDIESPDTKQESLSDVLNKREDIIMDWLCSYADIIDKWSYKGLCIPLHTLPMMPISITYIRENPAETEEEKEDIEALFSAKEWKEIYKDTEVFECVSESVYQCIPPYRAVLRLYETYSKDISWSENDNERSFLLYLMNLLSFYRQLPEYNCYQKYEYSSADISEINSDNAEFWYYFLMVGYDLRAEEKISPLRRFMNDIYQPSLEWRKEFCKYKDGLTDKDNISALEIKLNDGKIVRIEFHLHYVEYFLNGRRITASPFSFSQLCRYSEALERQEYFFFLLGMTNIKENEKGAAIKELDKRLRMLPLYSITVPDIAMYLLENCKEPEGLEKNQGIDTILYEDTERFCFRIRLKKRSMELMRLTYDGWVKFDLLSGEGKAYKSLTDSKDKLEMAGIKLKSLKQPEPVELKQFCLDGMDRMQKSKAVVDALRYSGREHRIARKARNEAFIPGFPWSSYELTPAVYDFFARDGGYMTNHFVVLHLGNQDKPCFRKMFTASMSIFGYKMRPDFSRELSHREQLLERRLPDNSLIVGRIGWGEEEAQIPIAVGEDGTIYSCRDKEIKSADNLEELLYIMFDFSDVTQISTYEGGITVSRLDGRLEYCYSNEDREKQLDSSIKEKTLPELFSDFWCF